MRVGFVGAGLMGAPMVRRLVDAGFDVVVSSRRPERLADTGWAVVDSPKAAADGADVVCSILPDSSDVEAVVEDVLAGAPAGCVLVEMSTHSPAVARALAERVEAAGVSYLDCPAGGGVKAVESGTLAFWVGGSDAAVAKARPVLAAIGDETLIRHCGPVGTALAVKLANNYLCAVSAIASAEALAMVREAGVDPLLAIDAITTGGGGTNAQLANLFPKRVLQGDFTPGFRLDYMAKDVRHARELARHLGIEQALAEAVAARLDEAVEAYGPTVDFGSVTRLNGW